MSFLEAAEKADNKICFGNVNSIFYSSSTEQQNICNYSFEYFTRVYIELIKNTVFYYTLILGGPKECQCYLLEVT